MISPPKMARGWCGSWVLKKFYIGRRRKGGFYAVCNALGLWVTLAERVITAARSAACRRVAPTARSAGGRRSRPEGAQRHVHWNIYLRSYAKKFEAVLHVQYHLSIVSPRAAINTVRGNSRGCFCILYYV